MVKEAFLNLLFQCGASGLEAVLISFRSPETIQDYLKPSNFSSEKPSKKADILQSLGYAVCT